MTDITIKHTPLTSLGYITCNVPDDVMLSIRSEVNEIKDNNFKTATRYNRSLAGQLEHEYGLVKCGVIINKFIKAVVPQYFLLTGIPDLSSCECNISTMNGIPDLWVNYQKKYEFNPLHDHGGDLSFIIYLDIPYSMEEEINQPHSVNSYIPQPPGLYFAYTSSEQRLSNTIKVHKIPVDKKWVNTMVLFPSGLQHYVTPFYTSDNYRISVSGNIVCKHNG
jgi:hypothetical protein